MSFIVSVLSYYIGESCILIVVWPSLDFVHSLAIVGVLYCTMVLMCALPDKSPVKVVLFGSGTNVPAVDIYNFLIHTSV